MNFKEKRKNLDPDELRAISRQSIEVAEAKYQHKVDDFVIQIEKRLAQGKFAPNGDGYLSVRMWGEKDWRFIERVQYELRKHYSETDYDLGMWTTVFKVKP